MAVDEPLAFELYAGTTDGGSGLAHDLHADRLGSIITVVETGTGTVASTAKYTAFGTRTANGQPIRYGCTPREHDAA